MAKVESKLSEDIANVKNEVDKVEVKCELKDATLNVQLKMEENLKGQTGYARHYHHHSAGRAAFVL
ncbi:hypothetical protein [Bacteroidetes bacterium endosymbiont of Geopemphigus sp.]|uniref:hypothetical protein n=1 Tax=Bacteroidetes bacterium endosymbiont of Geopemphigus sp. TaxID=2047937 RepID=UPI000CD0EC7C|nr:hypothetical protein [Bacteroidetes bacterium endosymbiont of Geopemphigus sp.]